MSKSTKTYIRFLANSNVLKNTASIFGSICTVAMVMKFINQTNNKNSQLNIDNDSVSAFDDLNEDHIIASKLGNTRSYIEGRNFDNLISLPRYKLALFSVKQACKHQSKESYELVIDELSRLNLEKNKDPVINDGFVHQIKHLLNDDLMLELALNAPYVDNNFFRIEPPTTIRKMNKILNSWDYNEDLDYGLIFEFFNNYLPELSKKFKKKSSINTLITRLNTDINSLLISDYFISERSKLNNWSTDVDDLNVYDLEWDISGSVSDSFKLNDLKNKFKSEFIERNELNIMILVEKLAKLDIEKFVEMNGLELLIFLYEKHKFDETYLNSIGNCLCLISLNPENRRLFIQSGWLKRLNEMSKRNNNIYKENQQIKLVHELISHKILFNLKQGLLNSKETRKNQSSNKKNKPQLNTEPLYYSTMLYPLNPIDSDFIKKSSNTIDYKNEKIKKLVGNHEHVVDVIFVHGLRGSLFRTWRQDRPPKTEKKEKIISSEPENEFTRLENKILDKLNKLIEEINPEVRGYSYCWPKDWLNSDLRDILSKNQQGESETKFRVLGVNYESLFSTWEKENFNDKELKGIKEHAYELELQLKKAHVGERPIIWVCHSMGGLIIKQLLVNLNGIEKKLDLKKDDKKVLKSSIVNNTQAIVFLSTPHLGSPIATTMTNLSFAMFPSDETLDLATNNKCLLELNKKFLELFKTVHYKILSIYENKPTFYFANLYLRTVTEESAKIGIGESYKAEEKDHLNVCKPENKECEIYGKILNLISELFEVNNSACENCLLELKVIEKRNEKYNFQLFSNFNNF